MKNKRYKGLTLAEVLITLSIIGVIAATTIPSLNNDIKGNEIVERVKKYQSVFSQAVQKYMLDNGCINNLSLCNAFKVNSGTAWSALQPYFNVIEDCGTSNGCFPNVTYKCINGTNWVNIYGDSNFTKAVLSDGAIISVYDLGGNCSYDLSINDQMPLIEGCGTLLVDINGKKAPNQIGRDFFFWRVTSTGVIPLTSDDTSNGCDPLSTDVTPGSNGEAGEGQGCAAKILIEGAINY